MMIWVLIGAIVGLGLWFIFMAPFQARDWHKRRAACGLPPKDPPGLIGIRERLFRSKRNS